MSHRTWQERFQDIVMCIRNNFFTAGMTYDDFFDDLKTIRAVAFELTTIGESARAIPDQQRRQNP